MSERLWLNRKNATTVKALYRAGSVFVKVHAERYVEFGIQRWRFTGSHCDAEGKVFADASGAPKIHPVSHVLAIHSDIEADLAADFEQAFLVVVDRVRNAVKNEAFDPLTALRA